MYSGSSGLLAFLLTRCVLPLIGMGWLRRACLDALPPAAFQALCDSHATQLRLMVWLIDQFIVLGSALAGVPMRQLALGGSESSRDYWRASSRHAFAQRIATIRLPSSPRRSFTRPTFVATTTSLSATCSDITPVRVCLG